MKPDPLQRLRQSHKTLSALGIPHGLIGGWAVIAWGRVRATRDLDWLALIPDSRRKEVIAALSEYGSPEWRPPGEDDPIAGLIRVVSQRPGGAAGWTLRMPGNCCGSMPAAWMKPSLRMLAAPAV